MLTWPPAILHVTPKVCYNFFVILPAAGLVIVYGIWMLLVTTAFWFVQVANIAGPGWPGPTLSPP